MLVQMSPREMSLPQVSSDERDPILLGTLDRHQNKRLRYSVLTIACLLGAALLWRGSATSQKESAISDELVSLPGQRGVVASETLNKEPAMRFRWAKYPGMCLHVFGMMQGAKLQLVNCYSKIINPDEMLFRFPPDQGAGNIAWAARDLCLAETVLGREPEFVPCPTSQAAKYHSQSYWVVNPNGNGRVHSGMDMSKCLTVVGGDNVASGAKVTLGDCHKESALSFIREGAPKQVHWGKYPDQCVSVDPTTDTPQTLQCSTTKARFMVPANGAKGPIIWVEKPHLCLHAHSDTAMGSILGLKFLPCSGPEETWMWTVDATVAENTCLVDKPTNCLQSPTGSVANGQQVQLVSAKCRWTGWATWSDCSNSCADGVRKRVRHQVSEMMMSTHNYCKQTGTEHQDCALGDCPVAGHAAAGFRPGGAGAEECPHGWIQKCPYPRDDCFAHVSGGVPLNVLIVPIQECADQCKATSKCGTFEYDAVTGACHRNGVAKPNDVRKTGRILCQPGGLSTLAPAQDTTSLEPVIGNTNKPRWGGTPNCESATQLDFLNAEILINNLGGKGPIMSDAHAITYAKIAALRDVSTGAVQSINLVVRSLSKYSPAEAALNGKQEEFGMLSVGAGTSVNVEFRFEDDSQQDVIMPNVIFTIVGMANPKGQALKRQVTSCESARYYRSERSAVYAAEDYPDDGCVTFMSLEESKDNATLWALRAEHLTETQRNEAVALQFKNIASFHLTFEAIGQGTGPFSEDVDVSNGLSFSFAGQSNVAGCYKF